MPENERTLKTVSASVFSTINQEYINGIEQYFESKNSYLNTCNHSITIANRRNEIITIPNRQNNINTVNFYNQPIIDDPFRKRGLYVLNTSSANNDVYESFFNWIETSTNGLNEELQEDIENLQFMIGGIDVNKNRSDRHYINYDNRLMDYETWKKNGGRFNCSWSILYFIPEEKISNFDTIYVPEIDSVLSFCSASMIKNHPYSKYGVKERELINLRKNLENGFEPRIRFIDQTKVLGNLFVKTNTGCRLIYPEKNPEPGLDDGIYIDHVWFDIDKPRQNQIKHIKILYNDLKSLAEYGIYHNYSEVMESDRLKDIIEKEKYKYQYHKEKEANSESKLKEYGKVLGYLAAIITAFLPLILRNKF